MSEGRRPVPQPLTVHYTLAGQLRAHMAGRPVYSERVVELIDAIAAAGLELVEKRPRSTDPMTRTCEVDE